MTNANARPRIKTVTLRVSLLRGVILIILALSAFILAITYLGANRRLEDLARTIIGQKLDQTEDRLRRFFDPVERGLEVARRWVENDLIELDDRQRINDLFKPLMERFPHITSVMVADTNDREVMLLRDGETWVNRVTDVAEWGERKQWIEWSGRHDAQPEQSWKTMDYQPTSRPWFEGALSTRDRVQYDDSSPENGTESPAPIFWTDPYIFFTTQEPGMTAAVLVPSENESDPDVVVAFDVLLRDLSAFTTQQAVATHGMLFAGVRQDDEVRLIGLPRDEQFSTREQIAANVLKRPRDLGMPIIDEAIAQLGEPSAAAADPFSFNALGDDWWGQYRPMMLGVNRELMVGVIVPEHDLIGEIERIRWWIVLITIFAISIGIAQAILLSRRFSEPIEALVDETERIRGGDFDNPREIPSTVAEILRLTSAVDRMRNGLRSLFKIERDLQIARQIQESTFPIAFPDIPGYDIAAWAQAADETAGDSYDVIGWNTSEHGERNLATESQSAAYACFLLADATGHGIGPALSVTQVRSMVRMALRVGTPLGELVTQMNNQLCDDLPSGRFVTAWFGELDTEQHMLRSISAGQGPILTYLASSGTFAERSADHIPLGIDPQHQRYQTVDESFATGDVIAVISDGVFEARNEAGVLFGATRVCECLQDVASRSADDMMRSLLAACKAFMGNVRPEDDQTIIIIKRMT